MNLSTHFMNNKDEIQRFIFDDYDIRGQLVCLTDSYQSAIEHHHHPEPINRLIGEFMAAAALLSTGIKIQGTVSLQAQGKGDLSLIMAECYHGHEVRAIARWQGEKCHDNLQSLLADGQLVITIDPDEGQRYQGIVPIESSTLAECLELYFEKSEQLKTRVWLTTEPNVLASGLFIQALPGSAKRQNEFDQDKDAWNRICQLSDTLTLQEIKELDNDALLHRLYHQEALRVFPVNPILYKCGCDRDRTINALVALGQEEVKQIFSEQPELSVTCEFCNKIYLFVFEDISASFLLQENIEITGNPDPKRTLH